MELYLKGAKCQILPSIVVLVRRKGLRQNQGVHSFRVYSHFTRYPGEQGQVETFRERIKQTKKSKNNNTIHPTHNTQFKIF